MNNKSTMQQKELKKTYEPHEVEDKWIKEWIDRDYFAPNQKGKHSYSIVIPPPNVTGSLHMGHALNNTLQDILIRYHRMKGDATLWVVGTDHAGIATQNVVEKQLQVEGKTRFDLGREKFIERVWEWKKQSGGTILNQLKKLGASCDYANERFTMDEGLSAAVRKVFVQLYHEGLIYRGERLINWCPRCHTALSDLEVEHEEQKGKLWHIRYQIVGAGLSRPGSETEPLHIVIATTRPETLLGDTAVAVHPEDERYKAFVGAQLIVPLQNREIPVIADDYVSQEFGSGVVKITPAHDFNDFEVGKRHQLPVINILTADGKINENGKPYEGLSTSKARQKIIEDLEKVELLEKVEDYKNTVGHCYRCRTVVEPYLSTQWYVKTKPLAKPAIDAVKSGKTRFVPQHWEKTYFNWMENIQDWCISRQIWWGHQIPAWYCENSVAGDQSPGAGEKNTGNRQLATGNCVPIVSETPPSQCPTCGFSELTQDPDVLDTWFSSALWPFSTLGWPEQTEKLKTFYPTSALVTAFDIIFFWVARMMMLGIHFMKEVPFKDVHIHAIVRDPLGQKMSKSKGNVVDPLILMEKYGTDAFRFTLAAFAAQGRDIKLDEARVEGYRNFCNKIWNATRFAMMNAKPFIKSETDFMSISPSLSVNQWILFELAETIQLVEKAITNYDFNQAAGSLYRFFWNCFCDWYLEFTKINFKDGTEDQKIETARTIYHVLDVSFRLLHPFMPFITEEIWQKLSDNRTGKSIVKSDFPVPFKLSPEFFKVKKEFDRLIEVIGAIRNIRQETGVPLVADIVMYFCAEKKVQDIYTEGNLVSKIMKIGKLVDNGLYLKPLDFVPDEKCAVAYLSQAILYIPLQGLIDIDKELARQQKKMAKVEKDKIQLEGQLNNSDFLNHAEGNVVEEKQEALRNALSEIEMIKKAIFMLKK